MNLSLTEHEPDQNQLQFHHELQPVVYVHPLLELVMIKTKEVLIPIWIINDLNR